MATDTTLELKFKGETHKFDYRTLTIKESMELQLVTGYTPAMLFADFARGGIFGVAALLLVALHRAGNDISWDDLLNEEAFSIAGKGSLEGAEDVDPSEAPSPAPQRKQRVRKPSTKR